MKREVRCLYRALLKPDQLLSLRKILQMYREWDAFRDLIDSTDEAPAAMKRIFMPQLDAPQYINWAKKYLI